MSDLGVLSWAKPSGSPGKEDLVKAALIQSQPHDIPSPIPITAPPCQGRALPPGHQTTAPRGIMSWKSGFWGKEIPVA